MNQGAVRWHRTLTFDEWEKALRSDVLKTISARHTVTHCPFCGSAVETHPICSLGEQISRDNGGRLGSPESHEWKSCSTCQVVWRLTLFNWRHELDESRYYEGHRLMLLCYSNCFCRTRITPAENLGIIHDSEGDHSALRLTRDCGTK